METSVFNIVEFILHNLLVFGLLDEEFDELFFSFSPVASTFDFNLFQLVLVLVLVRVFVPILLPCSYLFSLSTLSIFMLC